MIHIERKPAPRGFMSADTGQLFKKLRSHFKEDYDLRSQKGYSFESFEVTVTMLREMETAFNGKCAYCESPVSVQDKSTGVDFFRPRKDAKGFDNEFSRDHYWWLALDWSNMYLVCLSCKRFKESWFPVRGSRAKIKTPYKEIIHTEHNLLIDPCNDYPEEHITYNDKAEIVAVTDKGEVTIDLLKLNRPDLVAARLKRLELMRAFTDDFMAAANNDKITAAEAENIILIFIDALKDLSTKDLGRAYAGIQRWHVARWIGDYFSLDLFLKGDAMFARMDTSAAFLKVLGFYKAAFKSALDDARKSYTVIQENKKRKSLNIKSGIDDFFIDRIEIKNFKAIDSLIVKFPDPPGKIHEEHTKKEKKEQQAQKEEEEQEPWLMLLGENGVGKSTFLQAVAYTIMGSRYRKGMEVKSSSLLRHGTDHGYVNIFVHGLSEPVWFRFNSDLRYAKGDLLNAPSFLLGYGATRMVAGNKLLSERIAARIRVANLFRPQVALTNPERWILELYNRSKRSKKNRELFDRVGLALKKLLLFDEKQQLVVENGDVLIRSSKTRYDRLEELSDGYRSVIAIAVDMMKVIIQKNTTIEAARGLVLIDEIGTHLHPSWRMQVVSRFRKVFPGLQFIVTTHDPLCLRGMKKGEVVVLEKDNRHRIRVLTDLPDHSEYRVDQLLTSPFFGLNSVVDPALEKDFDKYYLLLRKPNPTAAEKKAIKDLQDKLQPKVHLGDGLREEMIYKAVDEVIARSDLKMPKGIRVSQEIKSTPAKDDRNVAVSKETADVEQEVKDRIKKLLA